MPFHLFETTLNISVPVGETYLVKSHACDFLTDDYVLDVIPPKRNGLTAANSARAGKVVSVDFTKKVIFH